MKEQREISLSIEAGISNLLMDDGNSCEIFLPENPRERLPFENEYCSFKPSGWARLGGIWYPLGYKVVTENLQSLNLRGPHKIMTFPVGSWIEEDENLEPSMVDWGGIWSALRKGSIKDLKVHCWNTHRTKTKGFLTAIYNPVYNNTYRIKSEAVMMLKEIIDPASDPWRS